MQRLETTTDLLDALQERYGWTSDNQVAKGLGIPQGTIANYRTGRTTPTEVHAITIAKALDMEPLHVLAIAAADRSPDEKTRKEWLAQIARVFVAVAIGMGAASTGYSPPAQAQGAESVYSVKPRRRRPPADPIAA